MFHRYFLVLSIPGEGEKAVTSGTLFDGLQSEEALALDGPMFQELGMIEAMQKPGAVTAAINWYRCAPSTYTLGLEVPEGGYIPAE